MGLPSPRVRRLIILGMLAAAASLFSIAVIIERDNPGSSALPVAIQQVSPEPGSNVLSQSDVLVDLAVGYTADLEINGFEIPEEELIRVSGLNQVRYMPGANKTVEQLRPDQNCVRVRYWLISVGPNDAATYDWCFDAS